MADAVNDAVDKPPTGFTSYATGGGPAGKWLVKEMSDSPSGKHVVEQTNADSTDTRFPVLIADKGEYADLDVSVKGKALSGKVDQGIGLVFRFRDPKSYYVVRANALEDNFRLFRMLNGRRLQFAGANVKVPSRLNCCDLLQLKACGRTCGVRGGSAPLCEPRRSRGGSA